MKVLVTGATGFVGHRLVPFLTESGHDVVAVVRTVARALASANVEQIACDLRDPEVTDAFPGRVDAVVHLAQANVHRSAEQELVAVNTASTAMLLEYAHRAGAASFVLASSGSIYGGSEWPLREDDPARPADAYARSKVSAERLVHERHGAHAATIFRLFAPYGPSQRGRLIPELIALVRSHQPVTLRPEGRPRLNPIYVDDILPIFAQALVPRDDDVCVVNVAGDEVLSIREMADAIGRVVGAVPVFVERADGRHPNLIGDTTRLRRLFNLPAQLVTFESGVGRTVAAEIEAASR